MESWDNESPYPAVLRSSCAWEVFPINPGQTQLPSFIKYRQCFPFGPRERCTMNATPLNDLVRRISNQEAELQKLRREFEERQRKLASLTQRKKALQAQLRQIEAETAALVTGVPKKSKVSRPTPAKASKGQPARNGKSSLTKPSVPSRNSTTKAGLTLPHLIMRIVEEAHGPLSVKQIAKEALRRGFTSTSGNFRKMVAIRVRELRKKGGLRAADGQAGFVLGKSSRSQTASARKLPKNNSRSGTPTAWKNSKPAQGNRKGEQPSLRSVLTKLLEGSKGPLLVRDLAKRALAAGYRSISKDFDNVVKATLGKMEELVNVPGKGYRLKKGKG
jgi:hypothetical protein